MGALLGSYQQSNSTWQKAHQEQTLRWEGGIHRGSQSRSDILSQAWLIVPILQRLRQEDYKFEASLITCEVPGQPELHSDPLGVSHDTLEEAA